MPDGWSGLAFPATKERNNRVAIPRMLTFWIRGVMCPHPGNSHDTLLILRARKITPISPQQTTIALIICAFSPISELPTSRSPAALSGSKSLHSGSI